MVWALCTMSVECLKVISSVLCNDFMTSYRFLHTKISDSKVSQNE